MSSVRSINGREERPTLGQRSLTSVRWAARTPRIAFLAALSIVAAAGLRAIFAPAAAAPGHTVSAALRDDRPVEAFAEGFARAYLTWDARWPERHRQALAAYLPREVDPDGGVALPRV